MCTSSRSYQDMLASRREEISNFMWVSRQLKPQIAYKQQHKSSPQYHKDEVLKSPKIQELLMTLSRQQNVAVEVLQAQVKNVLDEIGYNKKTKLIRWLGFALVKICNRVCSGIYINRDAILRLKSQMGSCPVIFVPSHRSYADFILMSLICFSEDVAIPAIAAGMDFHGMWGMGTVLRDTGAFFMRRTYNNDSLYWTTFKQYIYQLVTKGELPIEFFIEGTRSRSNKSLMPKYGLILMILKAFFLSQVPDIWFVPINISYDRIMEEKLFAFELLGIPKPKESTSGFFKSLSIVKEKYGSIYFGMAEPISAKKFFGSDLDRSAHSLRPIYQQEITEQEKKLIPSLAHEIVYQQQKHCVITAFNLVALILHHNLFNSKRPLDVQELIEEALWLKEVLEAFGAFVQTGDVETNVLEALEVHKNIVEVEENGKVTLVWNEIVLDEANVLKLKGHDLSAKTLTICVPFIMLQLYVNPALHYLVDSAIVVMVLRGEALTEDELFGRYHFLRALLSQEFVTFSTREQTEFEEALQNCLKLNLIARNEGLFESGKNKKCEDVVCHCIDGFIFAYFVVCSVLLQTVDGVIDEKSILMRVQAEIEVRLHEDNAFIHPYSLSLDTITNCLSTLSDQKILIKSRSKNDILYEINRPEVLSVKSRLEKFVSPNQVLQRKLDSMQLHLKTKL